MTSNSHPLLRRTLVVATAVVAAYGAVGALGPVPAQAAASDHASARGQQQSAQVDAAVPAIVAIPADAAAKPHGVARGHTKNGTAATVGAVTAPQPLSSADLNAGGANNGGNCGAYCSTRDGSPSRNGNAGGAATGRPCAGCVGKADNKNPPGQRPDATDANNGYECDGNHGIARTNPAHTGCRPPTPLCVQNCGTPPPSVCIPTAKNHFCSTVKGTRHHRPPATPPVTGTPPATPPKVLGERFVRTPPTLPMTGTDTAPLLLVALVTTSVGCGLVLVGRRRGSSTP